MKKYVGNHVVTIFFQSLKNEKRYVLPKRTPVCDCDFAAKCGAAAAAVRGRTAGVLKKLDLLEKFWKILN